jgi:hypothetical protein
MDLFQVAKRYGEYSSRSGLPGWPTHGINHSGQIPGPTNQPAGTDNHRNGCGHTAEAQSQV